MKKSGSKRGKKAKEQSLFDAIRKPLAPPGHPLAEAKPQARARPAQRKAKHKRPPASDE